MCEICSAQKAKSWPQWWRSLPRRRRSSPMNPTHWWRSCPLRWRSPWPSGCWRWPQKHKKPTSDPAKMLKNWNIFSGTLKGFKKHAHLYLLVDQQFSLIRAKHQETIKCIGTGHLKSMLRSNKGDFCVLMSDLPLCHQSFPEGCAEQLWLGSERASTLRTHTPSSHTAVTFYKGHRKCFYLVLV